MEWLMIIAFYGIVLSPIFMILIWLYVEATNRNMWIRILIGSGAIVVSAIMYTGYSTKALEARIRNSSNYWEEVSAALESNDLEAAQAVLAKRLKRGG